jgi:drug/metabolite transporter (DMT)-like permease
VSVPASYLTIVAVWSTTPLAIAWSTETVSPSAALALRMLVASIVGYLLIRALKVKLSWSLQARKTYFYSQFGIVGAMLCVYFSARYIPSGLISVLFALAPIFATIYAWFLVNERDITLDKQLAFVVAFFGLVSIFSDDLLIQGEGWKGVLLLLLAVNLYSYSGVKVQQVGFQSHPLATTVGSVICSLPLFAIAWYVFDGSAPTMDWSSSSPYAILYLAVFGSLLGFCAYFYLVQAAGAAAVAMVTLLTPVLALILGSVVNGEEVGVRVYFGTGLIILGLAIYYRRTFMNYVSREARSQGSTM